MKRYTKISIALINMIVPIILVILTSYIAKNISPSINLTTKNSNSTTLKYFEYLEVGLDNQLFDNNYVKIAYNHFDRLSNGKITKNGIVASLEDFSVYYNSKLSNKGNTSNLKYQKIITVLDSMNQVEPFASLPPEEKRLMDNLQTFINNNDITNTKITLNQLRQLLLNRRNEYNRIDRQNSWSLPLAIIGVIFTLLFGAWSTVLAIKKGSTIIRNK